MILNEARGAAVRTTHAVSEDSQSSSNAPSCAALREALRCQEAGCAAGQPSFASIVARIEAEPSALESSGWSVNKSARLAASLAASQLRIVPQTVFYAALIVASTAVGAAYLIAPLQSTTDTLWWFSAVLLFGVALTVTVALSSDRADALALATPLGPQTVTLARLTIVLGIDAMAGLVASLVFSLGCASLDVGTIVAAWLVPLAAIAGTSACIAIWSGASWVGVVVGAILIPLVLPAAHVASGIGMGALVANLQSTLGPTGIVFIGIVLLMAAICSARQAKLAHVLSA